MTEKALPPQDCISMDQVRIGVDETDHQLVALLTRRFGYMHAAARIKQDRGAVRDEDRKAQVVEAVRQAAAEHGLPADELAALWDRLVEISINFEMEEWDRLRA